MKAVASNPRVAFQLASERASLKGPGGKRLLVHLVVNVEHWPFAAAMPRAVLPSPHGRETIPDVCNFSWAEYGIRCGLPRLIELFGAQGLPASASVNLDVIRVYPQAAEAMRRAGWEFIGHGLVQQAVTGVGEEEQIRRVATELAEFAGGPVRGWLSPGLRETAITPDLLAEQGFSYCMNWGIDDLPCWMATRTGRLMAMPYSMELNDSVVFAVQNQPAADFATRIMDTIAWFDRPEAAGRTAVLGIGLHPHLIAVPHRLVHLARALEALAARDDVAFLTGSEIADWYAAAEPHPDDRGDTGP